MWVWVVGANMVLTVQQLDDGRLFVHAWYFSHIKFTFCEKVYLVVHHRESLGLYRGLR